MFGKVGFQRFKTIAVSRERFSVFPQPIAQKLYEGGGGWRYLAGILTLIEVEHFLHAGEA